jgi:hypothetical protein
MESDDQLKFTPDKGPVKLTVTAKLVLLGIVSLIVIYFMPPIWKDDSVVEVEPGIAPVVDYEVVPVFDSDYYWVAKNLFDNAREEIFIAQYIIDCPSKTRDGWPKWRQDRVLELVESIIDAHRRGVKVDVVVSEDSEKATGKNYANKITCQYLEHYGVSCRHQKGRVRLHDKVVMVDKKWVLQGSHNWTIGPLTTNKEVSLLMEAREGKEWTWEHYREAIEEGG